LTTCHFPGRKIQLTNCQVATNGLPRPPGAFGHTVSVGFNEGSATIANVSGIFSEHHSSMMQLGK